MYPVLDPRRDPGKVSRVGGLRDCLFSPSPLFPLFLSLSFWGKLTELTVRKPVSSQKASERSDSWNASERGKLPFFCFQRGQLKYLTGSVSCSGRKRGVCACGRQGPTKCHSRVTVTENTLSFPHPPTHGSPLPKKFVLRDLTIL